MHRRNRSCIALRLVCALAALWIALSAAVLYSQQAAADDGEPLYRGRTLGEWLEMLERRTDEEVLLAIKAVGEFGPESREHANALAQKLRSHKREIRLAAAHQLATWGADAKNAGIALAWRLRDIDPDVGQAAAAALKAIGKNASDDARVAVANAIEDRDEAVRSHAIAVMRAIGWHDESAAVLGRSLSSKDARIRVAALAAIGDVPKAIAQPLRAKVYPLFTDSDAAVRSQSLTALVRLGPEEAALPFLAAAVEHTDDDVKRDALKAATHPSLEEFSKPLAAKIAPLLTHESVRMRRDAARALWILEHRDARAASVLGEWLIDEGERNENIAIALGDLGPLAKDAVPQILKYFESSEKLKDEEFVASIGDTMAKIGPEGVKAMAGLLSARREDLRLAAAAALESMGTAAEPAVPELAAALGDTDVEVRVQAAKALGAVGTTAKPAADELAAATLTALTRYKASANPSTNRDLFEWRSPLTLIRGRVELPTEEASWLAAAAEAWYRVAGDVGAISALETLVRDESDPVRTVALAAIDRSVKMPPKSTLPGLLNVLRYCVAGYPAAPEETRARDQGNRFRRTGTSESIVHALNVLARLGDEAGSAVDSIATIASGDPRPEVALAAARAWWRIAAAAEAAKSAADCLTPVRFGAMSDDARRELVRAAVELLAEMGDAAKIALPQIVLAYQQSTDEQTRAAIGELLKKLDPAAASKAGVK